MKKLGRKILILLGIFLAAAIGLLLLMRSPEQAEVSYTVLGNATLPVISFRVEGASVNTLYGYTTPVDSGEAQESLTPLPEDRELQVRIDPNNNTITSIAYEVRSLDGTNLIEQITLDTWADDSGTVVAVFPIKDLIKAGREYSLRIILTTEKHGKLYYYTRILWGNDMKTVEMLDYITDFHSSTYSAAAAEKYAINWEVDGTGDVELLSHVDIHSNFNQLTWRDLAPEETERPQYTILEMDPTFGYFRVCYEMSATDEDGRLKQYRVQEDFCLQWSAARFYLMSYDRHAEEIFDPTKDIDSEGNIVFGMVEPDQVELVRSEDGKVLAMETNGTLWEYLKEDHTFAEIFSFRDGEKLSARLNRKYDIRIMHVDDNGNVEFFVYGYMNKGSHEGMNGLSYYRYQKEENLLEEVLFIPSQHSYQLLRRDLDVLATKRGNQFYFLFDDTVYVLSDDGSEIIRMLDHVSAHHMVVNEDQTAIAWAQGDDLDRANQLQIRYLDTASIQSITAEEGEYLQPHGFIVRDFVSSAGRIDEIGTSDIGVIYPQYSMQVRNEAWDIVAEYQYPDIYLTDVTVTDGQIALNRIRRTADGFEPMEQDVLMQNDHEVPAAEKLLANKVVEKRHRIYYLAEGVSGGRMNYLAPEQVAYGESISGAADDKGMEYYGYVGDRLMTVSEKAGEAITEVYDHMGYVTDSEGRRIWHRTAKYPEKVTMSVGTEVQVSAEEDRLAGCIDGILRHENVIADVKSMLAAGMSPQEILANGLPDADVVDLTGCSMKQLYIFLSRETPLLAYDTEGRPMIIVGYDLYNIVVYDPVEGKTHKIGQNDAAALFEEAGSRFLGYVR